MLVIIVFNCYQVIIYDNYYIFDYLMILILIRCLLYVGCLQINRLVIILDCLVDIFINNMLIPVL